MGYSRLIVAEILARWDRLALPDLENISLDRIQLATLLQAQYDFCRNRAELRNVEIGF